MVIQDLLSRDAVMELREPDKSRMLQAIGRKAASMLDLSPDQVAKALLAREALGSTGMGGGVAIPHTRFPGLTAPFGLFAHLKPAIAFDAIDDAPVDLVFVLLLPEQPPDGQLKAMACVARRLRDPDLASKLRSAHGTPKLFDLLVAG